MSGNNLFFDPLSELDGNIDKGEDNTIKKEKIHIRKQQRNRRKCIVTISGLSPYFDNNKKKMKKIAKELQKNITHSSIALKEDKEYGMVLIVQGDWRKEIRDWLISSEITVKNNIIVHGD